ncbi:MAG: 8-amino-7-oxononanoate synthase [Thermodesulfobacteriota bacterium]|nr:MAG: 8-amino-7-oxononanoate synthase [Thermodesulfobacteriota bacterium]
MIWSEIIKEIEELKQKNLYRRLRELKILSPTHAIINGKEVILFCSNNYLGLTHHPEVINVANEIIKKYGTGSGASRLISGHNHLYKELENTLAKFKEVEAALVFSTGYTTNIGVISALVGRKDAIFCDKLAHASIIDGCLLSGAKIFRFKHNDLEHLKWLLEKETQYRRRLIITEGVFSMDGDLAPLPEIYELAGKYDAILLVDDAHGTGVIGEKGKGTLAYYGIKGERIIQIGTLSKAIGALGGFVGGSKIFIEYLINKARSFIFTTALPPAVIASAKKAIEILENDSTLLQKLRENILILRKGISELGFKLPPYPTPIIPLIVGEAEKALKLSERLFEEGFFIPAIRPPAVPKGSARLRITVSAMHTKKEINKLLNTIKKLINEL